MTPPEIVGRRYRLGDVIGDGGTATVYEAEDIRTGRIVAIKLLRPELAAQRASWEAFFEEVRAAQAIDHPGVVSIDDDGVDSTSPPVVWIAMERVHGLTLRDAVRANGRLNPQMALTVAEALLSVVEAAHAHGIVHRDITPANVMFDSTASDVRASVRLLDFGLADVPGRSTLGGDVLLSGIGDQTGVIASVPFASPEHLTASPVTEVSDLYQLAATLYFAFAGEPPYVGDAEAQLRAHLKGAPPDLHTSCPDLPVGLSRWLARAMQGDPRRRYATATQMRLGLDAETVGRLRAPAPPLPDSAEAVAEPPTEHTLVLAHPRIERTAVLRTTDPIVAGAEAHFRSTRRDRSRRSGLAWGALGVGVVSLAALVAVAAAADPAPVPEAEITPTVVESVAPQAVETAEPVAETVELVLVPPLEGRSRGEAEALLRDAGFVVGSIAHEDAVIAAETVLRSEPASGSSREKGSSVSLTLASGNTPVPTVAGLTPPDAMAVLRGAGFDVEYSGSLEVRIAGTRPAQGSVLALGSRVILDATEPTPSHTPTPSPSVPTSTQTPTPTPLDSPDGASR